MRAALIVIGLLTTAAHAEVRAIPVLEKLTGSMQYEVTYGFEPAPCIAMLGKLRELEVPATATITLARPTRFLTNGTHDLAAVDRACRAMQDAGRSERVRVALRDAITTQHPAACAYVWPMARRAGVAAHEPFDEEIVVRGKRVRVTGTLAQLVHKYCLQPHAVNIARRAADRRAWVARYTRYLRRDKRTIYLRHGWITLPDGDRSQDPARLGEARVWLYIESSLSLRCPRRATRVVRYEFDAAHRLVSKSMQQTCDERAFDEVSRGRIRRPRASP